VSRRANVGMAGRGSWSLSSIFRRNGDFGGGGEVTRGGRGGGGAFLSMSNSARGGGGSGPAVASRPGR
jgi:hypothetical protein